jgi:deazaflavin-dependent oxidoreductase (nitroreductase family)
VNIIERVGGSKWFLRLAPKFVPQMDNFVYKLTRGRVLPTSLYMPMIRITSIGRRSGEPRTVVVATIPHEGNFIVVGSNYGQEHHPAWSHNLIANPEATAEYRGKVFPVTAHRASPEEKAELWPTIVGQWPNFDRYSEHSGGRDLRVFVLQPQGQPR